jgi:uncharacterized protein YodC (DUF2158 family)
MLFLRANQEGVMAFEPGDVVFLKSGGSPMTVAAVDEDDVDCLWLGEEGELFRQTIPSIALIIGADAADEDATDDDDTEDEHDDTNSEEADEDEARPAKNKRKAV